VVDLTGRHPATIAIMRFFAHDHLPPRLQPYAARCATLAELQVVSLPDGAELTTGLRKLLEAKDCFVRAALDLPNDEAPADYDG
jgi:hypothetical protein